MSWQRCRSAGICFGQPLKLYAVIFAHRSLKMFAEHIVQLVPEPAEGMPVPARSVSVSVPVLNAKLEISEDTP